MREGREGGVERRQGGLVFLRGLECVIGDDGDGG